MNNIEKISKIKRENLDERNYLKTLLENAYDNKMLTDDDIVDLQIQLLQLLDEIIYKYNGLDSSSIRKEVMEDISNSNIYTIGLYLKTFRNPDDAINKLKEGGIQLTYQKGRKQINKMLNFIRVLYIKVKQNKLDVENEMYNGTILGGISGFLKIYNPDFKAQDMKITADYPLYNNLIGKLDGVEFIKEYIYSIYLENIFCNKFQADKVKHLLYEYSYNFEKLVINIFEIVFLETIACKLVKRNIQDLMISNTELNEIYDIFKDKERTEIIEIINRTYQEIKNELLLDNQELQKYIERNLDYIVKLIVNGLKNKTLDKIFIIQKFIEY